MSDFPKRTSKLAEEIYTGEVAALRLINQIVAKGPLRDEVPLDSSQPLKRFSDEEQHEAAYLHLVRLHQVFAALLLQKARELGIDPPQPDENANDWILYGFCPTYFASFADGGLS